MKRRTLHLMISLFGGLVLTLALVLLVGPFTPVRAAPDVRYVAPGGDCNGPTPCYAGVQAAVDAAAAGDEIRVAAGTYTGVSTREGVTQLAYIDRTVSIRGGYTTDNWTTPDPTANPTTLDAQGQGRVLYVTANTTPTIEGLRITGGDASGLGGGYFGFDCGGGVYVDHGTAAVQLSNNAILSNRARVGGGICLYYGAATLTGNEISLNTAEGSGGGLWLDRTDGAVLHSNTIFSNSADQGGGAYLLWGGTSLLKDNVIDSNVVAFNGAGLYVDENAVTLDGNLIRGNVVSVGGPNWWNGGGGVQMRVSDAVLVNNAIIDNQSAATGGGIKIRGGTVRMSHNTFARNTSEDGSGVQVLAEPSGWGACNLVLNNTVLVSHSVGITVTGGNTVTVDGVLWHNTPITLLQAVGANVTVQNQYQGDPAFAADGYHLTSGSAAIDRGIDADVASDIDGDVRPMGHGYDLGADEVRIALSVTKHADPDPVAPGEQLTYTISVVNTGDVDLDAIITDTLPAHVTSSGAAPLPGGASGITWTANITAPGGVWAETVVVTVAQDYGGALINRVGVTTEEGARGEALVIVNARRIFLPLVLR